MKLKTMVATVLLTVAVAATALCLLPGVSAEHAIGDDPADAANIGWIMICSMLVFIMSPGVALFYGGMLRKQSMSSIIAQTLIAMGVMAISWVLVGYSLAFSDGNMLVGGLENVLLRGVSYDTIGGTNDYIPDMEFMLFQMMFALITAGIVLGACAERIKYTSMTWFLIVWSVLVYAPMAHMVWGGGLLTNLPFDLTTLDFAGGTVVHICAATTGLALAIYLGRRSTSNLQRPHSIPMAFIGCFLLWFGWFGFNGGSGLAADGTAINAMVVSQIAAVFAMASWAIVQYLHVGRVGVLGLIAGAVAGLVGITPAAGYVNASDAIIIGLVAGVLCYFGVIVMRKKSGVDDALDVMGVHGFGGMWGAIATGLFASSEYGGLVYSGDWHLLVGQLVAILVTVVFCFVASYAIIFVIGHVIRDTRISNNEEAMGQDIVEHGEPAYYL